MKNLHNVMSNTKHTEGPWLAKWSTHEGGDNSPKKGWFVTDQREVLMLIDIPDSGTSEANAKLIAAAPELLDMLIWYVDNFPQTGKITEAKALIKKATE